MDGHNSVPASLRDFVITDIQLGRQIGRGANGRILEAKWEGISVAVKEIHAIFINEASEAEFQSFKRSFLRECEQSSRLRHPNIVRFLGIYHPPGVRVPSLVMERLHCSLTTLLEQNPTIPTATKKSIIHDVALGVRYLHSRTPPIIHRDLSSNNVLISKGMEGKIGDLGTARLVDPRMQSQMTKAPGTVDFMPPEALAASENVTYERELDVFSLGCIMLHMLSHQWPTPSEAVVLDPKTGLVWHGRSEVERRSKYFSNIDQSQFGTLIQLIESCLSNLPKNRIPIVRLCEQLEGLVDREQANNYTVSALQQEIRRKDALIQAKDAEIHSKNAEIQSKNAEIQLQATELQSKDVEIATLRSNITKLQIKTNQSSAKKVKYTIMLFYRYYISFSDQQEWH